MAKWTGKRVGVSFNKPNEPSFLKEFKKRVGYKEGPGVEDKFAELPPATAEDLADDDEDLPQVVTSGGRNALSAAELETLQKKGDLQQLLATGAASGSADGEGGSDQKIVFRKPVSKRPLDSKEEEEDENEATVDDRDTSALKDKEKRLKKKKKKHEDKKRKLLSFDEEVDDE